MEQLTPKTDPAPRAGLGFDEDEEDEEDRPLMNRPSGNAQSGSTQQTRTQQKKSANDTPILDNFGTDLTKAAEEGKLAPCAVWNGGVGGGNLRAHLCGRRWSRSRR